MKTFYGGTYIGKEILAENNIYHPIRLEYYKVEKEENLGVFYGIEVVKTEYKTEQPEIETNTVEHITMEETEVVELLEKFKQGTVMPSVLKEMVAEQFQNKEELCC